jgi:hypothetical protein
MTNDELYKLLENKAKTYRLTALSSIKRNKHMNDCKNPRASQNIIDALLVDFINYVALGQGLNLGLYTKDLRNER